MSLLLLILLNLKIFLVGYVNVQSEQTHKRTKLRTLFIGYLLCVCAVLCLASQSCLTLRPRDCSSPSSSVHRDSPDKNIGVGCHALLQGIFPTQGSHPGFPHCRWILYCLSHQGSPYVSVVAIIIVFLYFLT